MKKEHKNDCRDCIVGEHHYNRSCNDCPDRIKRALTIQIDLDKIDLETE